MKDVGNSAITWESVLIIFDEKWMEVDFLMSRDTFEYVLWLVKPSSEQKTTGWRKPLEPLLRLSVVLWWYTTPSEYRIISCLFGVVILKVYILVCQATCSKGVLCSSSFFFL